MGRASGAYLRIACRSAGRQAACWPGSLAAAAILSTVRLGGGAPGGGGAGVGLGLAGGCCLRPAAGGAPRPAPASSAAPARRASAAASSALGRSRCTRRARGASKQACPRSVRARAASKLTPGLTICCCSLHHLHLLFLEERVILGVPELSQLWGDVGRLPGSSPGAGQRPRHLPPAAGARRQRGQRQGGGTGTGAGTAGARCVLRCNGLRQVGVHAGRQQGAKGSSSSRGTSGASLLLCAAPAAPAAAAAPGQPPVLVGLVCDPASGGEGGRVDAWRPALRLPTCTVRSTRAAACCHPRAAARSPPCSDRPAAARATRRAAHLRPARPAASAAAAWAGSAMRLALRETSMESTCASQLGCCPMLRRPTGELAPLSRGTSGSSLGSASGTAGSCGQKAGGVEGRRRAEGRRVGDGQRGREGLVGWVLSVWTGNPPAAQAAPQAGVGPVAGGRRPEAHKVVWLRVRRRQVEVKPRGARPDGRRHGRQVCRLACRGGRQRRGGAGLWAEAGGCTPACVPWLLLLTAN